MMTRVSVLGSGQVGQTLADGLLKHGYHVMRASRTPDKLSGWMEKAGDKAHVGLPDEAAKYGELVVLAVKGTAAETALDLLGPENLVDKVIIDATNPIADAPPENGVVRFFTNLDESLMERLQRKVPKAHFVKAFSCVGNALMVNPDFAGQTPTMFICGNHTAAKEKVMGILTRFGWESEDMGGVEAARAIEPLCMLWCIRGFRHNQWVHAFKLLKA